MITEEKRLELEDLIGRVNLTKICDRLGVRRASVYEVLSGKSRNVELLAMVMAEVRKEVSKQNRVLKKV
ncbi:hypothetical protein DCC81_24690 [Chitinophaga parva]|uniref:Uncharacterized protein n=1 Tax=Chitinophaga parva TaxID=2169414 RepID=A0A2T7BBL7_9BACT|nr:hypothetical protein DCC81_24690 [Chitinophaga parva]